MQNRKFLLLLTFFASFIWLNSFSRTILPTHFLKEGLAFEEMVFGTFLVFLGQLLVLFTIKSLNSKTSWQASLIFTFLYVLLVIRIFSPLQFYFASLILGFPIYFFWIFYNIAHFENTPKQKTGYSSALMFNLPSFIGIIAPLAAGYLAEINILFIWVFSGISFLLSYYLVNFQEDFKITYTIKSAISEIKATRIFLFLEGVWEALVFGIIPIYSLFFIKTPLNYGTYMAYLALTGIAANFLLGRFTDKVQKRVIFLYPLTIIMAFVTFLFSLATYDIRIWIILTGLIQFLLPIFWNLTTAMVIDAHPNLKTAIPGRELMLGLGRTIGLFLVFLSFSLEKTPNYIFFVLGFTMLLYPLNLFWKAKIRKHHDYL